MELFKVRRISIGGSTIFTRSLYREIYLTIVGRTEVTVFVYYFNSHISQVFSIKKNFVSNKKSLRMNLPTELTLDVRHWAILKQLKMM